MADKRAERIAELIRPLRVKPGSRVDLARDFDPGYKADLVKKKDGRQLLETGIGLLADYQRRLAAQDTYGVLVCLQALDAGGKDGTIRHVMSGVNPQGVQVSGFKVPSAEELDHDYLWRYACRLPARGPGSSSGWTCRRRTGSSPRPMSGSGSGGMTTSRRSRRCCRPPAPAGRRGM